MLGSVRHRPTQLAFPNSFSTHSGNKGNKEDRGITSPPSLSTSKRPRVRTRGLFASSLVVCLLPDAYYLLDLLRQRLLLLGPPPIVLLLPVAGFLLHQPALGHPVRLFLELAVLLRVAHRWSPPSVHKRRLPWPLTNAYPMVWEEKQEDP